MMLIIQAKEAENLRNKEMKKYAEDREHGLKQQNEVVGSNYTFSLMYYFTCFLWFVEFISGILIGLYMVNFFFFKVPLLFVL